MTDPCRAALLALTSKLELIQSDAEWVRLDSQERNERPWHWWRDRFVERHNELREAMK
jgi:hypothetical protein